MTWYDPAVLPIRKPSLGQNPDGATPEVVTSMPGDEVVPSKEKEEAPRPRFRLQPPIKAPFWIKGIPFFLSAFLFLSGIFALFAPLPIILLGIQSNRKWAWLAALTNGAIVGLTMGVPSLAVYITTILALALFLPEYLKPGRSLASVAGLTLLTIAVTGLVWVAGYSQFHHVNPWLEFRTDLNDGLDYLLKSISPEARTNLLGGLETEEWKHAFVIELPSRIAVLSLVLVWLNLVVVLRLNPVGIRERMGLDGSFFKRWKAPEILIWPVIAVGFVALLDSGWIADVAKNILYFLAAIFVFQGLSILSFLLDAWGAKGPLRTIAFLVALLLMMPLLLAMGFFDLWFDFRSKLRQA